jgi:SEC-C motif-containing protein
MDAMTCPCQRQQDNPKFYAACCEPFHKGKVPDLPEQLMRSRFSAYALGLGDYVKKTWHPSTCPNDLNLEADDQWIKLNIVSSDKKQVHFQAYFKNENTKAQNRYNVLEETSDFVFENGRWFYVSGDSQITEYKQQRNESCLCGSGKKHKKCCAQS